MAANPRGGCGTKEGRRNGAVAGTGKSAGGCAPVVRCLWGASARVDWPGDGTPAAETSGEMRRCEASARAGSWERDLDEPPARRARRGCRSPPLHSRPGGAATGSARSATQRRQTGRPVSPSSALGAPHAAPCARSARCTLHSATPHSPGTEKTAPGWWTRRWRCDGQRNVRKLVTDIDSHARVSCVGFG